VSENSVALPPAIDCSASRLVGRQLGQQLVGGGAQLGDLVAVGRLDQGIARGEVAVERADADARALGDLLQRALGAALGEQLDRGREQLLAVAGGVLAEWLVVGRRGHKWRVPPVCVRLPKRRLPPIQCRT
jgi:hypothetical protein